MQNCCQIGIKCTAWHDLLGSSIACRLHRVFFDMRGKAGDLQVWFGGPEVRNHWDCDFRFQVNYERLNRRISKPGIEHFDGSNWTGRDFEVIGQGLDSSRPHKVAGKIEEHLARIGVNFEYSF